MQITSLLAGRRSTRSFLQGIVDKEVIDNVLEAARWAPSGGNRQPWRFVVRTEPALRAEMAPCLTAGNQWALGAPVLVTLVTRVADGDRKNRIPYAYFDCGLAVMSLLVEAEAQGLKGHVMAGWNRDPLVRLLRLPDGFEPLVVIALGYPGSPESLEPELRDKELRPRRRKALEEIRSPDYFNPEWDLPLDE